MMSNFLRIKVLFTIFIFLFSTFIVSAEISVSIENIVTDKDLVSIPVNATTENWNGKNVKYQFVFNYVQVEVLDVYTSKQNDNIDNWKFEYIEGKRYLTVTSNKFPNNYDGQLFTIDIRILPRMDFFMQYEEPTITPLYVEVDSDRTTFNNPPTKIEISNWDIKVEQTYQTSVSYNYPNPFRLQTTIFISLLKEENIKMMLHSFAGEILQTIPQDTNGCFVFSLYNAKNEEVKMTEEAVYPKGLYKIVLTSRVEKLAHGNYRLLFLIGDTKSSLNINYAS